MEARSLLVAADHGSESQSSFAFDEAPSAAADQVPSPEANIRKHVSPAALPVSSGPKAASDASDAGPDAPGTMSARAYQLEMLEQSLKRNVIVIMDTGSGKTQVAVLRIKAELEKCAPDKIIWFLAHSVALCGQQFDTIKLQVAAAPVRLVTGNENVETWSEGTWDVVLKSARVIVSTHQVLLDALSHAFVTMDRLALIVFDEAHRCVKNDPGGKIMTNFYHSAENGAKPSILGLTATPSMNARATNIEALEDTLDATCVSPTIHREELLKHVKRPQISQATYESPTNPEYTFHMKLLRQAYRNLELKDDPYILKLKANPTERNMRDLKKAIEKSDTFSQNQMKKLWGACREVLRELGSWAADRYIWKTITVFLERIQKGNDFFDTWRNGEKRYLAAALGPVLSQTPSYAPEEKAQISDKAHVLVKELLSMEDSPVGIVFVKDRATVSMLCEVLAACPPIVEKYRIGSMVGTSNLQARKRNIYELVTKADSLSLQNFRSGKINLLIATSVLEEGIDVPACNLVICFDEPQTLTAFVQRRGRARTRESRLVVLFEASSRAPRQWEALEAEMRRQYEDEERERQKLELLEKPEGTALSPFVVEATGAKLDFDMAKSHLEHFCRVLSQGEFVDSRPDYIVTRNPDDGGQLRASVLLPSFLPPELRQAKSMRSWHSEKNATKDAAFQAYVALYHAGLVSDNLLPFKPDELHGVESRAPMVDVDQPLKPWKRVALSWKTPGQRWLQGLTCHDQNGEKTGDYEILLPVPLEQPRPMQMYLDHGTRCEIRFDPGRFVSESEARDIPDHTSTFLALHFAHRWQMEVGKHVIRARVADGDVSMDQIGARPLQIEDEEVESGRYLVRDPSRTPFVYDGMLPSKPPMDMVQHPFFEYENAPPNVPYVIVKKWTKRSDFLHRLTEEPAKDSTTAKPYPQVLPLPWTTVDTIPMKHARFGMLIPSILHEFEVMLVAKDLATSLLHPVGISDLQLVREAISSRSASEPVDYERLEFLGDSILKYCTTVQMAADHLKWPEGYLSLSRDHLIANSRLSRAAQEKGLSKFILSKSFTGQKWRPLYNDDLLGEEPDTAAPRRKLSTKVLADVVEALIGASYQDGGISKALRCISLFIGNLTWRDVSLGRDALFSAEEGGRLPPMLAPLETLIGYTFTKKSLLVQAVTHASYVADSRGRSLERFEFIGDAILDNIIVTKLFAKTPPLPHSQMHMLKTAMVNGDFLAFIALESGIHQTETIVSAGGEIEKKDVQLSLWQFMRHASIPIGLQQEATTKRYLALRQDVRAAVASGSHYPWAQLARLQAKKFYSDMVESILGAVWVDSGSMDACKAMVARLGIMPYLERILREGVHVQHPKEELGKWAVAETVTYDIGVRGAVDGDKEFTCRVLVGERLLAEVDGGVSREEVKTKAAAEAVEVLSSEKRARDS